MSQQQMKFEGLIAWQKALDLSAKIHDLKRKFPSEEKFVLASQIQRAADSIALNIAEGSTGQTNKVFRNFLNYAIRSGIEVIACLHLGQRRKIISEDDFKHIYKETQEVIKISQGLKNSLKD